MWTPETLAVICAIFLLAGFAKGIVGFGLPTVSLALLTVLFGLTEAMALMVIPAFLTNVWQGVVGPDFKVVLRRLWPLLGAGAAAIWLAVILLAQWDATILSGVLGLLLCVYAGYGLAAPRVDLAGGSERWLGPLVGAVSGLVTGLTGSAVIPAVPYFQALGLSRHALVQAMGVWFALATLVLGVSLRRHDMLPADLALLSLVALAPAILGMIAGQRVRHRVSEVRFRIVFLWALFLLGAYIAIRSLV
ncbi:MAG: sulfite exporter TauE/SafE family protein [Alphaproteobacteria bacterium]|nr:sulfite exporter TauE/SafE family protein [Alphaproteobacteria bacterium]